MSEFLWRPSREIRSVADAKFHWCPDAVSQLGHVDVVIGFEQPHASLIGANADASRIQSSLKDRESGETVSFEVAAPFMPRSVFESLSPAVVEMPHDSSLGRPSADVPWRWSALHVEGDPTAVVPLAHAETRNGRTGVDDDHAVWDSRFDIMAPFAERMGKQAAPSGMPVQIDLGMEEGGGAPVEVNIANHVSSVSTWPHEAKPVTAGDSASHAVIASNKMAKLKLKPFKRDHYGKGLCDGDTVLTWRVEEWNGDPHHDKVKETLTLAGKSWCAFHIDKDGTFYIHNDDAGFRPPKPDEHKLISRLTHLKWGGISVEEYENKHHMSFATLPMTEWPHSYTRDESCHKWSFERDCHSQDSDENVDREWDDQDEWTDNEHWGPRVAATYHDQFGNDWQTGLCDAYALALLREYPHLRLGGSGDIDPTSGQGGPSHWWAHDDHHAYDSLGVHPLPYLGANNQFNHQWLDQDPEVWGLPENATEEQMQIAQREIQHQRSSKLAARLRWQPPAHRLWWQPKDGWGRGLITPANEVYTWPEDEMNHIQRAKSIGVPDDPTRHFLISPEGQVSMHQTEGQQYLDDILAATHLQADPNYHKRTEWGWEGQEPPADDPGIEVAQRTVHNPPISSPPSPDTPDLRRARTHTANIYSGDTVTIPSSMTVTGDTDTVTYPQADLPVRFKSGHEVHQINEAALSGHSSLERARAILAASQGGQSIRSIAESHPKAISGHPIPVQPSTPSQSLGRPYRALEAHSNDIQCNGWSWMGENRPRFREFPVTSGIRESTDIAGADFNWGMAKGVTKWEFGSHRLSSLNRGPMRTLHMGAKWSWDSEGSPYESSWGTVSAEHSLRCPHCGSPTFTWPYETYLHCRSCGQTTPIGWDDPESWSEADSPMNWGRMVSLPTEDRSPELINPEGWSFGPPHQGSKHAYEGTMNWTPGSWGKGLILDGQLHSWNTNTGLEDGPWGASHHAQYLRDRGIDVWNDKDFDRYSDPVVISPQGWYTGNAQTQKITPEITRFAEAHPQLKYVADHDKWERRTGKVAGEPPTWVPVSIARPPIGQLMSRRPVAFSPANNALYVGPHGSTHSDLVANVDLPDEPVFGWVGHNPDAYPSDAVYRRGDPNEVGWYLDSGRPSFAAHQLAMEMADQHARNGKAAAQGDPDWNDPRVPHVRVYEPQGVPDEYGEFDEEPYPYNHELDPTDEFDSVPEQAARILQDYGVTEPSQSPGWSRGTWYTHPDQYGWSGHLQNLTPEQEHEVWTILQSGNQYIPDTFPEGWTSRKVATIGGYCLNCKTNSTEPLPDGGSYCRNCGRQSPPIQHTPDTEYDPTVNARITCPECSGGLNNYGPVTFQWQGHPDPNCPMCQGRGYIEHPRTTEGYRTPESYWPLLKNPVKIPQGWAHRGKVAVMQPPKPDPIRGKIDATTMAVMKNLMDNGLSEDQAFARATEWASGMDPAGWNIQDGNAIPRTKQDYPGVAGDAAYNLDNPLNRYKVPEIPEGWKLPPQHNDPYLSAVKTAEDYWMQHRPAGPDDDVGAQLHDLEQVMPDFYSHPEYYRTGDDAYDRESVNAAMQARGNPDAMVTIHRSGPSNMINTGDWVSLSHGYAKQNGMHSDDPSQDMKVWSARVPAHTVWSPGDSINEFGYWGPRIEGQRFYRTLSNPELRPGNEIESSIKTADKLHDFLMNPKSRPDLQTPEGQAFLQHLEKFYHSPQTDALMPWLTREWKKGRLGFRRVQLPEDEGRANLIRTSPGYQEWPTFPALHIAEPMTDGDLNVRAVRLTPGNVSHWADFYNSTHPVRRQMGDIMQETIPSYWQRVQNWNEAMEAEAERKALEGGKVVHTTPDGWTVRQLTTPEELEAEGNAMGHCVGGYSGQVANGDSLIYSLRDPQGMPHVTTEIEPQRYEWTDSLGTHQGDTAMYHNNVPITHPIPHRGAVIQIQGQANRDPKPEYKERMRNWFESFPEEERPQWSDDLGDWSYLQNARDIEPSHLNTHGMDEYGLARPKPEANYPDLLNSTIESPYARGYDVFEHDLGDKVYQFAKVHGEIPQLAHAMENFNDTQNANFDDWLDQNQHLAPWPKTQVGEYNEMTPEEQEEAWQQAQDDWRDEMANEHPGMQAISHMYSLLNPHWNPQTQQYENEPYDPERTGSVSSRMGTWPGMEAPRRPKAPVREHRHWSTGQPCHCGFTRHLNRVATTIKEWPASYEDGWYGRRPVLYDPNEDTINIGPNAGTHPALMREIGYRPGFYRDEVEFPLGWVGPNPEADQYDYVFNRKTPREIGWYGVTPRPPAQVHMLLSDWWKNQPEVPTHATPFDQTMPVR